MQEIKEDFSQTLLQKLAIEIHAQQKATMLNHARILNLIKTKE